MVEIFAIFAFALFILFLTTWRSDEKQMIGISSSDFTRIFKLKDVSSIILNIANCRGREGRNFLHISKYSCQDLRKLFECSTASSPLGRGVDLPHRLRKSCM